MMGAILAISSCSKEGATGPVGPTGPTGPTGSNASTAFQLSFTVNPTDWVQNGTSGTAGAEIYYVYSDTNFLYSNVGHGAVLVYLNGTTIQGSNTLYLLPFANFNSSGTRFTQQMNWNDGSVGIFEFNSLYSFTTFSSAVTYTVVVIPGTKDLPVGVDRSNYQSIINYYHPRTVK